MSETTRKVLIIGGCTVAGAAIAIAGYQIAKSQGWLGGSDDNSDASLHEGDLEE